MEPKIFFSLKDYKENYNSILKKFLTLYIDNDEEVFINDQIELYKTCVKNSKIVKLDFGMPVRLSDDTIVPYIEDTEASLKGEDMLEEVENVIRGNRISSSIDYEKAKNLTLSFNKIIEFLTNKKEHRNNKDCFSFLDDIRYNEYSDYDITIKLKEFTGNYDDELLKSLLKDIDLYLFIEKEYCESKYSSEAIDLEIEMRYKNNIEIPYLKHTDFESLTEKGKMYVLKKYGSKELYNENSSLIIDKEKLIYPFEFLNIYNLQMKIKLKLNVIKNNLNAPEIDNKKISAKWYALQYWMELNAKGYHPPKNQEGYIKSEIIKIGKERIKGSTGQGFYKEFYAIRDCINNAKKLNGIFGTNWREVISKMSNDDEVSDYINTIN